MRQSLGRRPAWQIAETEAPSKPTESPPDEEVAPDEEELGERRRRIIREIPDPTPQPGGE